MNAASSLFASVRRSALWRSGPSALAFIAATTLHAPAGAQDATRGRALFSELPAAPTQGSCISCHGNPAHNVNNILSAAGDPNRLIRATGTVSAMGFLRAHLVEADIVDITAYLATVVAETGDASLPNVLPHVDHFGLQQVGQPGGTRSLRITNRRATPLSLSAVVSTRPDRYSLSHDCPAILPAAATCTATIRFVPGFTGNARALASVIDADGRTLRSALLSGVGSSGPTAMLAWLDTTSQIDFGQVVVGGSETRATVLSNLSPIATRIETMRILGPQADQFRLGQDCQAATLSAGADCRAALAYAPVASGDAQAWVEVVADARSPSLLRITGTAFLAPSASAPPSANPGVPVGPSTAPDATASGGGSLSLLDLAGAMLMCCLLLRTGRRPAARGMSRRSRLPKLSSVSFQWRDDVPSNDCPRCRRVPDCMWRR